jgi:hypothetical protein
MSAVVDVDSMGAGTVSITPTVSNFVIARLDPAILHLDE